MAFMISTSNFPIRGNFATYASALAYYRAVKPKRGSDARPLCANRKGAYFIRLNPTTEAVELVYYSTAVVSITKRDTAILDLSYNSISTRLFAHAMTPISVFSHAGEAAIRANGKSYIGTRFEIDLKTREALSGQTQVFVRRVNRERAKPGQKLLRAMEKFRASAELLDPDMVERMMWQAQIVVALGSDCVRVADPTKPDTWYESVFTPLMRGGNWARRVEMVYTAFDAYDWVPLLDGALPPKGATYRVEVVK